LEAAMEAKTSKKDLSSNNNLRGMLMAGEFFLASVIATTFTKLVLKVNENKIDQSVKNSFCAEVLYILTSILKLGKSDIPPQPIDPDSYERICLCIKILSGTDPIVKLIILRECRDSFAQMLTEQQKNKSDAEAKPKEVNVQADDLLKIRQLKNKKAYQSDLEDDDLVDLKKVTGFGEKESEEKKLSRVFQLTGFSDPLYAEAYVMVHQYDIVLDVVVINQTGDTLQNVCLELATLGDLKLCERPQNYTIGPHDKRNIRANIKVSSTETGIVFGNIVYDIAGKPSSADKNIVILNDIHIDIMDYISPASCTDVQFRTMWAEFEWENKVAVNTSISDVNEFLQHIIKCTNMNCLTPKSTLSGDCGFLAANLYAKSVFGEDALANVCIEKQTDGKIGGYIRIRSKTQGIALSLGDKITLKQRSVEPN